MAGKPHVDHGSDSLRLAAFSLNGQRFGLPLAATERALPMVAISALPGCPDVVLGAINVHGTIVPVLDIRRRLGLPGGDYGPSAFLVLARTARRLVALPVDEVHGVVELASENVVPPDAVLPGIGHVSGIAALPDGFLLIHDLEAFFSIEEEQRLAEALGEDHR